MKHCARSTTQTEVASEIRTAVNLEAGNGQRRDLDSRNAQRKCCQKACNIHGGYGQNVRGKAVYHYCVIHSRRALRKGKLFAPSRTSPRTLSEKGRMKNAVRCFCSSTTGSISWVRRCSYLYSLSVIRIFEFASGKLGRRRDWF